MAADPTDVHPEYDHPTPDNYEAWSDEQIEQYRELKNADLDAQQAETQQELSAEAEETLAFLRSTADEESVPTETVDLGAELGAADSVTVTVRERVDGYLEERFDAITEEQNKDAPRIANIKSELIDSIVHLIVDDEEPDADPYDFSSRAMWEAFYYDEQVGGSEGLMDVFEIVADPAMERYEKLGNSHGRTRRRGSGR